MGAVMSRSASNLVGNSESRRNKRSTNESWGKTLDIKHPATFNWEVDNFKRHLDANLTDQFPTIYSPKYFPSTEPKLVLRFNLKPKGVNAETANYIGLHMQLLGCPKKSALIEYTVAIVDGKGKQQYTVEGSRELKANECECLDRFAPVEDVRSNASELLPGAKLTIVCKITAYTDQLEISGSSLGNYSQAAREAESQVGSDFGKLLLPEPKQTDFVIIVGEKEFPVHKMVLSTRSSVFAEKFQFEYAEKCGGRMELFDVEPADFKELLYFIYTGRVSKKKNLTFSLLAAATKYNVPSLKLLCEYAQSETLQVDTVAETLLQADMHKSAYLKEACYDFINWHANAVIATKGWKALTESRPHLALPVFKEHSHLDRTISRKGAKK